MIFGKKINLESKLILVKDTKYKDFNFTKPFLKWVGGKTQIIQQIIENFPKEKAAKVTIKAITIPLIAVKKFGSIPFKPSFAKMVPPLAITAPNKA